MENGKLEESIRETVKEIISKMGIESEIEIKKTLEEESEMLVCNIKTEDSNFLIGQYGVNLQSLQHLARLLVRKKLGEAEKIRFIIDVNSYRQEKNSSIEKMAKEMAEEAVREGKEIVLRPMSSYERRIVHMELSKNSKIKTESIGEGENRKVVIKPI